jgi:hypothetical protein
VIEPEIEKTLNCEVFGVERKRLDRIKSSFDRFVAFYSISRQWRCCEPSSSNFFNSHASRACKSVTMPKMISKAQSNDFRQQVLINSIMHLANILGIHQQACQCADVNDFTILPTTSCLPIFNITLILRMVASKRLMHQLLLWLVGLWNPLPMPSLLLTMAQCKFSILAARQSHELLYVVLD